MFSFLIIFSVNYCAINSVQGASLNNSNLNYLEQKLQRTNRQVDIGACTLPTILNGHIDIIENKNRKNKNILSLKVTCDNNYVLQPPTNALIYCANGLWNVDEFPRCKRCVKRSENPSIEESADSELICPESIFEKSIYRECGQRLDKTHLPFIVNGTIPKFAEFPWHVALYRKDPNDTVPTYHCGGSIINEKSILTVAHCLSDDFGIIINAREYYVVAGKYHKSYTSDIESSQTRKVIKTNLHPRYEGELTNFAWDIAVVTVDEPFKISSLVHAVCIDWKSQFENEHLKPEKYGEVAGWGETGINREEDDPELRILKVPFVENNECFQKVPNTFIKYITQDKFCAGYTNGSSVCNGDSGGGLVFEREDKYYIRGLVSVGLQENDRCDEYKLSTYTKVSKFISFIQQSIEIKDSSTTTAYEFLTTSFPTTLENIAEPSASSVGGSKSFMRDYKSVSCKTPNNEEGECVNSANCGPLKLASMDEWTEDVYNFVNDSKCDKEDEDKVCCGTIFNYVSVIRSKVNLLPTPGVCGRKTQVRKGRIFGGTNADLFDYPWMAILEFGLPEKSSMFFCTGFLINEKYVLTAAHCISRVPSADLQQGFRVRLGEYDTSSKIDCVNSYCADPPLNVDVENHEIHPLYNKSSLINDIGILRLSQNVSYTDFIRPICLPVNGETSSPGRRVFIAGWGITEFAGERSSIKQKVSVHIVSLEKCINYYENAVKITSSHICLADEEDTNPCTGDAGGPVMTTFNNSKDIYANGIVLFGPSCGLKLPSAAISVASYMDWILDVISP